MVKLPVVANQPAFVGECTVGNFRVGVYTPKWEQMLCNRVDYRYFTRKVPMEIGTYAVSGWPKVTYASDTVAGVFQPKGSTAIPFTVGISMKFDGLFWTLDPMSHGYRIVDLVDGLTYEAEGKPYEHTDSEVGGFAFRVCQMRLVEFP